MHLFGVPDSPATAALDRALWILHMQDPRPEKGGGRNTPHVLTGFTGRIRAASFVEGAWRLHNTAWWGFQDAHRAIALAAKELRGMVPEWKLGYQKGDRAPYQGESWVTYVGDRECPTPFHAAVWEVANASYAAWKETR